MADKSDLKTFKLDYTLKDVSLGEARAINQVIVSTVEAFDGQIGGGFSEVKAEKSIDEELNDLVRTGTFDADGILQPQEAPSIADEFVKALQAKIEAIHNAGPSASLDTQTWDAGYIHGLQFAIHLIEGEVDDD